MSKHTPGPWELWTSNSWRRFCAQAGGSVCEPIVQNDGHPDLYFRNGGADGPDARLIAAAPDLLEALQKVLVHFDEADCTHPIERHAIGSARIAIAKATGAA